MDCCSSVNCTRSQAMVYLYALRHEPNQHPCRQDRTTIIIVSAGNVSLGAAPSIIVDDPFPLQPSTRITRMAHPLEHPAEIPRLLVAPIRHIIIRRLATIDCPFRCSGCYDRLHAEPPDASHRSEVHRARTSPG